jgi:CRISPR/Cas system CMR-associated protein Cmr1 (group 7 of RAMP superfamily)
LASKTKVVKNRLKYSQNEALFIFVEKHLINFEKRSIKTTISQNLKVDKSQKSNWFLKIFFLFLINFFSPQKFPKKRVVFKWWTWSRFGCHSNKWTRSCGCSLYKPRILQSRQGNFLGNSYVQFLSKLSISRRNMCLRQRPNHQSDFLRNRKHQLKYQKNIWNISMFRFIFNLSGGSKFWHFRSFLRLDRYRLEIYETYRGKIYPWSCDSIWHFSTTHTNHLLNRG